MMVSLFMGIRDLEWINRVKPHQRWQVFVNVSRAQFCKTLVEEESSLKKMILRAAVQENAICLFLPYMPGCWTKIKKKSRMPYGSILHTNQLAKVAHVYPNKPLKAKALGAQDHTRWRSSVRPCFLYCECMYGHFCWHCLVFIRFLWESKCWDAS